jgi:hypothetical protein
MGKSTPERGGKNEENKFLGLDVSTQSLTALVINLSEAAVVFHTSLDFDDAYPSYRTKPVFPRKEAVGIYHGDSGLLSVYEACEQYVLGQGADPKEKIARIRKAN